MSDPSGEFARVPTIEEGTRPGHLCLVYDGELELIPPVVSFIQRGVTLSERCIYLNSRVDMLDRVIKNAVAAQKNGVKALVSLSEKESWLQGSTFDSGRLFAFLRELCFSAVTDGYKGVRIVCDMGWWAGRHDCSAEELLQVEAGLNYLVAEQDALLLCLYDRNIFMPGLLIEVAKLHPTLIISGKICQNIYHIPSDMYYSSSRGSDDLDQFFAASREAAGSVDEQRQLRQELEQAYGALAKKIYENWQEEENLRASEQQLQEQDNVLREQKRRFQTILQHMPLIIAGFDQEQRLVSCNHEFERLTGYRAEEVMGKRMLELFENLVGNDEELLRAHPPGGGYYKGYQLLLKCKNSEPSIVSWSNISKYVPIPGWSNWILGTDETQKHHAEGRLYKLRAELRQLGEELESVKYEFLAEYARPFTNLNRHNRTIREHFGSECSYRGLDLQQEVHEAVLEMVESIAAMLQFTILTVEDIASQNVDLSAMAVEIADKLRNRSGMEKPFFNIEEGVMVQGDGNLLRLAMEQLLEKAWKYAKSKVHPLIGFGTVQFEGGPAIFISGDDAIFSSDTDGGGRSSRLQWSDGGDGCGIGLATVQRIINLHKGRFWAAGEVGKPAAFLFRV